MAANTSYGRSIGSPLPLNPTRERGWLDGFGNLFRNENATWWRTRRWLIHVAIWTVLLNGILISALWAPTPQPQAQPQNQAGPDTSDPRVLGSLLFVLIGGLATGTGAIIIMQGVILDEKKSGTAEWILSKPVSRSAFILSKFTANALATLLIAIALQGILAYLLMSARLGGLLSIGAFLAGLGLLALHLLFYLSLTLMLGTLVDGRGAVMAIPLGILFGAQLVAGFAPWLVPFMPWTLVMPLGQSDLALAAAAMLGQPLPTVVPIVATMVWIVLFIGVAVWRFKRDEF
jgi:ABC-2 type transport system permease protein